MPYEGGGLEIAFDFVDHALTLHTTAGERRRMSLEPRTVQSFYAEYRTHLAGLGIDVAMNSTPVELVDVIPFEHDTTHASYDPGAVHDFWLSLVAANDVCSRFRGEFRGKASPVHFFWGAFDLAATRFSGRRAPVHPGGVPNCPDRVMQEAYSCEVSSCGYWPGGRDEGLFYAYAYPEPGGFRDAALSSPDASFDPVLGEFVLPYSAVRQAADPDATLLTFLRETFVVAETRAHWP